VVAARDPAALARVKATPAERLVGGAEELGLEARPFDPRQVVLAPWVQEKCRFGCSNYDRGGQCPPRSPAVADTEALVGSYERALLVRGEPPGAEFHGKMLALERAAFIAGHHRALVFVAGPCRLCAECEPDACRQPKLARPSLEASGVDVFATASRGGWQLRTLTAPDEPVSYVGLLLVE
jgi:predicted metal-binding protein